MSFICKTLANLTQIIVWSFFFYSMAVTLQSKVQHNEIFSQKLKVLVSFSYACTHTHARARARAHTHTNIYTHTHTCTYMFIGKSKVCGYIKKKHLFYWANTYFSTRSPFLLMHWIQRSILIEQIKYDRLKISNENSVNNYRSDYGLTDGPQCTSIYQETDRETEI